MTKVCSDTLLTIGFCCSSALLLSSRCQPWYLSTVAAQQRPPLGHFHCTDRQPCTLDISEANISCCHLSVPSLVPSLANPSLPTYLSLLVSPSFPLSFGSLVPWFIGFSLSLSLSFSLSLSLSLSFRPSLPPSFFYLQQHGCHLATALGLGWVAGGFLLSGSSHHGKFRGCF